jgi:hypothetical protein
MDDFDINTIKPLISNDLLKTVLDELDKIVLKISDRYDISHGDLKDYIRDDLNKLGIRLGIKKRNRRILPPDKQCMGRKLDGNQCTRGRHTKESEYCKSHANKLPLGRIDDEFIQKGPSQRGRKKKMDKKSMEYIMTHIETIDDINYLVDDRNMVLSFDTQTPKFLGVKVEGTIKTLDELGIKIC